MATKKKNPIAPIVSKSSKKINKLADRYEAIVKDQLAKGRTPAQAAATAYSKTQWSETVTDIVVAGSATSVDMVGAGMSFDRVRFLNKTFDGVKLSDRIVQSGELGSSAVSETISTSMLKARSWTAMALDIKRTDLISSDPTKRIGDLYASAREAFAGNDPKTLSQYKSVLAQTQRHVDRLLQSDAPKGALRKAYQRVINATERGSQIAVDKAVESAIQAKMRYNAQRIARTEIARSYVNARRNEMIADPDVVAMRFVLSTSHDIEDICDLHCGANLYGLGEGVYPLEKGPDYPFHPNCMCGVEDVFRDEVTQSGIFDSSGGDTFLADQSEEMQAAILGVSGKEEYQSGGDWQKIARNYDGQKKQGIIYL